MDKRILISLLLISLSGCLDSRVPKIDVSKISGSYRYTYPFGAVEFWNLLPNGTIEQLFYESWPPGNAGGPPFVSKGRWSVTGDEISLQDVTVFAEGYRNEIKLDRPKKIDGLEGARWAPSAGSLPAAIVVFYDTGYAYIKEPTNYKAAGIQ
jgi:hypothetical protein